MTKRESQAMAAARDYARYDRLGAVELRRQALALIYALVGRWAETDSGYKLVIPTNVRAGMEAEQ